MAHRGVPDQQTHSEAQQLFEQLIGTVGPTGLLSEEYDPLPSAH